MEFLITGATAADAPEILELQKTAYQSEAEVYGDWSLAPLAETLPEIRAEFETKTFLKAVASGVIIGSVRAFLDHGTCRIGRLIVHPDRQRNGIGTHLMARIESNFSEAVRYELFTGIRSTGNIRLYERLGYRVFRHEDLTPKVRLVFLEKPGPGPARP